MTENEALEILNNECEDISKVQIALKVAREALSEKQQYRTIGTAEEFKALKEKNVAKKVISFDYRDGHINYGCPTCKRKIISKINGEWCAGFFQEHCDRCGQKLDWSEE